MTATRLIVGLGNPGPDYARTRHNAGFWFLDRLLLAAGGRLSSEKKLGADLGRATIDGHELWLCKPHSYMNLSGLPTCAALRYFKLEAQQMLVAYDELDLAPGVVRLKFDGGHGGHNGLRDIHKHLGRTDYGRLRIGIGHPGHKDRVTGWVLGRPDSEAERQIDHALAQALAIVPLLARGAREQAMQTLHSPP